MCVTLRRPALALGIDTVVPFWGFVGTSTSHGGVVHLDLGGLRDSWRGAAVLAGAFPLGTHGNGTVWRGEITGGVDTWLRNCTNGD